MVTQAGGFCGLKEGLAGGANFGGKNLQYFERKCGLRVHDREEIGAADETYLRFGTGNRTERVRLITDERWKAEHGTRHRLEEKMVRPSWEFIVSLTAPCWRR